MEKREEPTSRRGRRRHIVWDVKRVPFTNLDCDNPDKNQNLQVLLLDGYEPFAFSDKNYGAILLRKKVYRYVAR